MLYKRLLVIIAISSTLLVSPRITIAQQSRPFVMPVAAVPGPSTWLLGQPYGNTVGAYNFGDAWYSAGQGLHFGIDLVMPCGTPLVAVGDGEVAFVDNLGFGSGPHNLLLSHPQSGVTTLYGHLLEAPNLQQGQFVQQGQVVGLSGDPDRTCDSRPHLHLEIRSMDFLTAFNPVDYIEANWDTLSTVGGFGYPLFEQDLFNTRQWITIDDQPPVIFRGRILNNYAQAWPPSNDNRPPVSARPARDAGVLAADMTWQARPFGFPGCCANPRWHPTDANLIHVIDGSPGQVAALFEWDINTGGITDNIRPAPPNSHSPDGTHEISRNGGQITITRLSDGASWLVATQGYLPAISADNSRLMWEISPPGFVPGTERPVVSIWVSDIIGQDARQLLSRQGIGAAWLDGSRLLVSHSENNTATLSVYDTRDDSSFDLGNWDRLRGLSIAPGGGKLLFYLAEGNQPTDRLYLLETQSDAQPQPIDWFGAWRWRDSNSVYYLPFDVNTNTHTLAYYNFITGEHRMLTDPLTTPFTIADGDWDVSLDGTRIVFRHAADQTMWLLEPVA